MVGGINISDESRSSRSTLYTNTKQKDLVRWVITKIITEQQWDEIIQIEKKYITCYFSGPYFLRTGFRKVLGIFGSRWDRREESMGKVAARTIPIIAGWNWRENPENVSQDGRPWLPLLIQSPLHYRFDHEEWVSHCLDKSIKFSPVTNVLPFGQFTSSSNSAVTLRPL